MSWVNIFNRNKQKATENTTVEKQEAAPELIRCPKCGKMVEKLRVAKRRYICYECEGYFRVKTSNRIRMVTDPNTFEEWFTEVEVSNPLAYEGYEEKLAEAREKTGLNEAFTVGKCKIFGEDAVVGVCDARFMMASMGHVLGERVTAAIERATKEKLPVFLFCCSGGARMQEGIISLMQMAKTSAAIKRHGEAGLLYSTILTDPTTGGVMASFAMLGDVIMAEPGALIGFAGPRVIRQTIGQELERNALITGTLGTVFLEDFQHAVQMTIKVQGQEEETLTYPMDINGFEYEIREASRCAAMGKFCSDIYPPKDSIALSQLLFDIRQSWNMQFDGE